MTLLSPEESWATGLLDLARRNSAANMTRVGVVEYITTLIVVDPDDEANDQMWENLTPVLMGLAPPKLSVDGSA